MKSFNKNQPKHRFYYLNYRIEAPQLRVIDAQGKQIGIFNKEEAIRMAKGQDLDLVLIAPNANPPVAKIVDFSKFLYQEEKREREAKKGIKKSVTKDLKLSLFIGPADFERLVKKGVEFLEQGNQLRVNLNLKGREIAKKEMAFDLIKRYLNQLGDNINVVKEPRLEGRVLRTVVSRKK